MKYLIVIGLLIPTVVWAQSTDHYWQQIVGAREAQSATQLVQLAKQVDDLQAQLTAAKKACPAKPEVKPDAKQKP